MGGLSRKEFLVALSAFAVSPYAICRGRVIKTALMPDRRCMPIWDGTEIRTAFFLKGYPLKCIRCHNPESIKPEVQASATNTVENLPAAKWDFEGSDGLVMKKCSICNDPERGKCLKLVSSASRATARTAAKLPDVASLKTPYTLAIWLKPDKSVISDADVEMAKFGGRRMTKFASAMHDGKWHHLAVTYDPARTNTEYAVYLDWPDEKSPWRFMSFYEKDTGMSKCILPFSFGDGKAVFGGKVGMSLFSVGYSGMIDDVAVYNRALTDDEVRDMAVAVSE